jgi:hypothetical protein
MTRRHRNIGKRSLTIVPDLALQDDRAAAIDALHAVTCLYTRAHVVDDLLDRIQWPSGTGSLVDPSCGDGAFLVAAIRRLRPRPGDFQSASRVNGWELHPAACASARANVAEELENVDWSPQNARQVANACIHEGDFLADGPPPGSVAYLVGNPPYPRLGNLPRIFKELYRLTMPPHARGDILDMFLARCGSVMATDGAIAFVTSDRWLSNANTSALREQIGRRSGIAHLRRIDAATSFYRPKFRRAGTPPRVHPVSIVLQPMREGLSPLGRAPVYPEVDSPGQNPETEETVPLSSIADVRLAPWLGPKGIFWIRMDSEAARRLPPDHLVPVIRTSDLSPHEDRLASPAHVAIRTCRNTEPCGAVTRHLKETLHLMPPRGRQATWWVPPELLPPTPSQEGLLIPRIARRLRPVPLPPGLVAIDHNFMVVSIAPGISIQALRRILLHSDVQRRAIDRAPRLENGFVDLRTKFVRALAIPRRLIDEELRANR